MPTRIKATHESNCGRNLRLHDNFTGEDMTRAEFVLAIESGGYPNHRVRVVKGVKTPAAHLDGNPRNKPRIGASQT